MENAREKDIRDFDDVFSELSVDCATFKTVVLLTYLSYSAVTIHPNK